MRQLTTTDRVDDPDHLKNTRDALKVLAQELQPEIQPDVTPSMWRDRKAALLGGHPIEVMQEFVAFLLLTSTFFPSTSEMADAILLAYKKTGQPKSADALRMEGAKSDRVRMRKEERQSSYARYDSSDGRVKFSVDARFSLGKGVYFIGANANAALDVVPGATVEMVERIMLPAQRVWSLDRDTPIEDIVNKLIKRLAREVFFARYGAPEVHAGGPAAVIERRRLASDFVYLSDAFVEKAVAINPSILHRQDPRFGAMLFDLLVTQTRSVHMAAEELGHATGALSIYEADGRDGDGTLSSYGPSLQRYVEEEILGRVRSVAEGAAGKSNLRVVRS